MKHPAKYSAELIPLFKNTLVEYGLQPEAKVLDPFAGTGKIHELPFDTYGIEIEPEWASMHPRTLCGDSTKMGFADAFFDAICTSPTYGNRMADHHEAKDNSKRNTYTHSLGRKLTENNTGAMQWGDDYKRLHEDVYAECFRVLKPNGIIIINMKNHIRQGVEVDVNKWHIECLVKLGFDLEKIVTVPLKGNGFGANGKVRTGVEYINMFRKSV
jgi:DNA modification methylase